jgi:hypothetical protein
MNIAVVARVEQEHIDNGFRKDCYKCPWTLALWEVFPDAYDIVVTSYDIYIHFRYPKSVLVSNSPIMVVKWIKDYDNKNHVEPTSAIIQFYERQ